MPSEERLLKMLDERVCYLERFGGLYQPTRPNTTYVKLDDVLKMLRYELETVRSAGSPQAPETPAQSDLPDEDVIEIDQDGAVTAVGPLARLKHDLAIERGNVQHLLDTCVPVEELNELREELATLKLASGSAQAPETPPTYSREEFERDRFGQTGDDIRQRKVAASSSDEQATSAGETAPAEKERCTVRTPIFGRCCRDAGHDGRHLNSMNESFSALAGRDTER